MTISFITSSRFGTRPVTELNSWRFTPLNTIRLPFSFMSPSTISNLLKPASWLINSVSFPCESLTIILTSYRFGFSALHSRGFFTLHEPSQSALSLSSISNSSSKSFALSYFSTDKSPSSYSFTLATPSPSAFIDTLSAPSSKVSLSVGTTDRSSTCAQGTAYKNTSLKMPENL